MKKCMMLILMVLLLSISSENKAAVNLGFGSTESTHGKITKIGGDVVLNFGFLELKGLSSSDPLYKAKLEIDDAKIDPLSKSSSIIGAMYSIEELTSVEAFALFADVNSDSIYERILYGDLHLDNLLVIDDAGTVDAEISIDVNNLSLDNVAMMNTFWLGVPTILTDIVSAGYLDLVINIASAGGTNLAAGIDAGGLIPDLVISGTTTSVPEPRVVSLMFLGLGIIYRSVRKK